MPTPLDYLSPAVRKAFRFDIGFRTAIGCALLPMIVGTSIYIAWHWTGEDFLQGLGLLTIFGGLLLFGAGFVALILYVIGEIAQKTMNRRRFTLRVALALGLLLVNFPLAGYFMNAGTRIVVDVRNSGATTLKDVRLVAPYDEGEKLGDIPPGTTRRGRIDVTGDGALAVTHTSADSSVGTILVEGYVTNGLTGRYTVDVKDGADVVKKVK